MRGIQAKLFSNKPILEQGHKAYSYLRSAAFSGEFTLLHGFSKLFKHYGELPEVVADPSLRPFLLREIDSLFTADARLFHDGICPWSLLLPESPLRHATRLGQIMVSGVAMSRLRKLRKTKTKVVDAEVPDYYQRHYHWQQGGYLTDASAQLYDHQVEILFKGTGAAMRRLIMRPLFDYLSQQDCACRILEVGAGTGLAAREVYDSFPFHHLTVSELSAPYLQRARDKFVGVAVDFVRAAAEELPFKDGEFDVLYSTFMFHELPRAVRERALEEFFRVLKPGGKLIVVDSIQRGDVAEFDPMLERFPRDYHEPFYKDYSQWPMDDAFERHGFTEITLGRGFFAKVVTGLRP